MSKRDTLKNIYLDTLEYSKTLYDINKLTPSIKLKLNPNTVPNSVKKNFVKTNIQVINQDVIKTTIELYNQIQSNSDKSKILVLNLASKKHFGGGVENGAMAQEEELFRKTDYGIHKGSELYPLSLNEFVFTSKVSIVKDEFYNKIHPNNIFQVDMLAMSALYNPVIIDGKLSKSDYDLTFSKIDNIFKFAISNSNTNLILGAIGCGVFYNPPLEIIEMFNKCLQKYNGHFENIIFSVKSSRDNNFDLFDKNILR